MSLLPISFLKYRRYVIILKSTQALFYFLPISFLKYRIHIIILKSTQALSENVTLPISFLKYRMYVIIFKSTQALSKCFAYLLFEISQLCHYFKKHVGTFPKIHKKSKVEKILDAKCPTSSSTPDRGRQVCFDQLRINCYGLCNL